LRGGVQRRESLWVAIVATETVLSGAGIDVLFTGYSAAVLALRPFTIVRTRGVVTFRSDQVATSELYNGVLAMAIVTDQALAAGVGSVPTGDTDRDSDAFFVYEEGMGIVQVVSAAGFEGAYGQQREFDSKAMRKVEDGFDIAVTIQATAQSNGMFIGKAGRQLIKLH